MRTDYGEEHSLSCGHPRFGPDFTGRALLPAWADGAPCHLVGHSFGGNTALTLFALLAQDFWSVGSGPGWVISVTCIASPLRSA